MKYVDACKTIYRYEGLKGFYHGFGVTLLTYVPSSAVWWMVYEQSKIVFSDHVFLNSQTRYIVTMIEHYIY